jgi:hypothetical protein
MGMNREASSLATRTFVLIIADVFSRIHFPSCLLSAKLYFERIIPTDIQSKQRPLYGILQFTHTLFFYMITQCICNL